MFLQAGANAGIFVGEIAAQNIEGNSDCPNDQRRDQTIFQGRDGPAVKLQFNPGPDEI
jgi:hypothetical protein